MKKRNSFDRLSTGNIIGIVDAYDAVHSVFTGDELGYHANHFPEHTHCQWRWSHSRDMWYTIMEYKPTPEQCESIRTHLTKKYGLRWLKNGHHDIDHLLSKCS